MTLFALLITLILCGSFYAYRIAFHASKKHNPPFTPMESPSVDNLRPRIRELYRTLADRPFEAVTIRSIDGLTLFARYYHTEDGAPLDICCHGYKSHPFMDFSGGSSLCFEMGHNLLLIDHRGHNNSDGKTITFGILERWDVKAWVDYSVTRFGQDLKITLYGVSMGASTALMTADLPLPKQVKAIVADCPYARPEDIILEVGRKMHYPPKLVRPLLHLGARLYGGFRLDQTDAIRAVRNTQIPILILHGDADTIVPCQMSEAIQQANPSLVRRYTFPGADHAVSYLTDEERYKNIIREFTEEILA